MRPATWLGSLRCAAAGVREAALTQRNMRAHFAAALAVAAAAVLLEVPAPELGVLALAAGGVLAAEVLNTAVESLVDLVSPNYHETARRAKDMAAGAVLLSAAAAVLAGTAVFLPRLLALLKGPGGAP